MRTPRPKPTDRIDCIYCGKTRESSKEHVIQDAIGGGEWIWEVCEPCNNEMGDIDDQLTVKSPLSILATRELGETGPRSWSLAPQSSGLLLEAKGGAGTDALRLYPQVIFDGDEIKFYCPNDELTLLGPDALQDTFYKRLKSAFEHFSIHGPNAERRNHKTADMLKIPICCEGFGRPTTTTPHLLPQAGFPI